MRNFSRKQNLYGRKQAGVEMLRCAKLRQASASYQQIGFAMSANHDLIAIFLMIDHVYFNNKQKLWSTAREVVLVKQFLMSSYSETILVK